MTTIVYDHKNKQIACDSRTSAGSYIVSDEAIKYRKKGDELWFVCGRTGEALTFVEHFEAMKEAHPRLDNDALFVFDGSVYLATISDGAFRETLCEASIAIGSGDDFAQSAIDFGKSAKQAIKYAATRDANTGGKVHVYDIEKADFI